MKVIFTFVNEIKKPRNITQENYDKIISEMLLAGEIKPLRTEIVYE